MTSASDSGVSFTYGCDEVGSRTRLTWPDAVYVTYSYDELNRMKEIRQGGTTLLASYTWDQLSRRSVITYGNNTTATYGYAANDDLTSIAHQLKASSVTFTYGYNLAAQRTSQQVSDDRHLWKPAANENLSYGTANGVNQYPSVGAASLSYDANGNLTGDGVNTFGYDTENRMVSWSTVSHAATYAYDPLGRRKSKTVDGTTTDYLSEGDREIAEHDGTGLLIRRFV